MVIDPSPKVLVIGWDAADWKVIHPLLDAGKMPNLEKMINSGVMGNLATLYPDLSPMLWTSIATGKRPFKHGVLGFTEPDPHGNGIRPITNLSRKTKAIWNILGQTGRKCNVIGWWPSHPVEPVNGVMVSNHYQSAVAPHGKPWPMRPGAVHPWRLLRNLADLRVHPQDLDVGLVLNFLPKMVEIDQEKDRRVESVAKIIAETATIERAASAIMHHEPWDFAAVYFDGIDHFCHGFMNYHPPRPAWVSEKDYELFKCVVESGYIYHDILLGRLLEKAGEDTLVMLFSDHGFHSDHLRPRNLPRESAGPAAQHRHYGIFVMKGPGVLEDETVYGATLLDICPTILAALGLPIGRDMDGKPLGAAFREAPVLQTIPSWDEVPGEDGSHPPDRRIDPVEAREAVNQLVALGYIEAPPENREEAVATTVRELRYNEARSYMDANRYLEAIPILKDLLEKWPDEYRFGVQLALCYEALGRIRETRPVIEEMFGRKHENARKALEQLKAFHEKHQETGYKDLTEKEKFQLRDLRAEAAPNPYAMEYLMGSLLFAEGDAEGALRHLRNAEKADAGRPGLYNKIADVYLKMKRWETAGQTFEKALDLDPENAAAHLGQAKAFLNQGLFQEAALAAMDAVGLLYNNPMGHFLLGTALVRLGEAERAVEALGVAVAQNPNFPEAWDKLVEIHAGPLRNPDEADNYREQAMEARRRIADIRAGTVSPALSKAEAAETIRESGRPGIKSGIEPVSEAPAAGPAINPGTDPADIITIVTGLPRSGTSMMMQMLAAGGIPALTDGQRRADEDNPRRYFELDRAAGLRTDASWLPEARGKTVKIIAQLLSHLPPENGSVYRVIFMERELTAVLASQKTMLEHRGKTGADLSGDKLKKIFAGQTDTAARMLAARGIPVLPVSYQECITAPEKAAGRVNAFFNHRLDERQMAAAIDPALNRHGTRAKRERQGA